MSYSLLAQLYPRIKGSLDVATFSLSYLLEQPEILNLTATKFLAEKLHVLLPERLSYHCQDNADSGTSKIQGD